ncbi:MAG: hypothetical protein OSB26_10965, partial [Woeseiaceae bacterium]|nr:hypothetical protein [Woeseiaceae bacterium]
RCWAHCLPRFANNMLILLLELIKTQQDDDLGDTYPIKTCRVVRWEFFPVIKTDKLSKAHGNIVGPL